MQNESRIKEVNDFWFKDLNHTPAYFSERLVLWFYAEEENDRIIRERFEKLLDEAVEGKLKNWESTPKGCIALIILLDQFSLTLYREEPRSYTQSALAIPVAEKLIKNGWEWTLTPAEKVFLYLPFEHSESLIDQESSVSRYQALTHGASPDLKGSVAGFLDYAIRHRRVVKKFGRFPDRNEVFGRESTPEEIKFLASDEAPF